MVINSPLAPMCKNYYSTFKSSQTPMPVICRYCISLSRSLDIAKQYLGPLYIEYTDEHYRGPYSFTSCFSRKTQ